MDSSRLVRYIQEFTPKERDKFQQFVISPYFNQHEKTIKLLEIILAELNRTKPRLNKVSVHNRLFPGENYDEQHLHNVMSYLKKLYYRFVAYSHFEESQLEEDVITVEAALENNKFDVLKNRGKQLEKRLKQMEYRDSDYYLTDFRLNRAMGYFHANFEDRSKTTYFNKMLDALDNYYIVEKLRHACHLTANMMIYNTQYDFEFLEVLLKHIENNWDKYESDKAIPLYYTIYHSLHDDIKEEHLLENYQRLKSMLEENVASLGRVQQGDLYSFASGFCVRQINLGHDEFRRELFLLYKYGIEFNLMLENGMISEWNFKNITALGCSLKEYEWTETFIQTYKEMLPAHRRENAYNYNLAHLYYYTKRYQDALSVLLLVQYIDVKYHLNASFLLLRTYFALKDTEALLSLIDTLRIYVMRNRKITTDLKRGYTNFLRFAKKLVLIRHQAPAYSRQTVEEKLQALAQKIEDTTNVINKYWLLEECGIETGLMV